MNAAEARRYGSRMRIPVAQEYWKIYNSAASQGWVDGIMGGQGYFFSNFCTGHVSSSGWIGYSIEIFLINKDGSRKTYEHFLPQIERLLATLGWGKFRSYSAQGPGDLATARRWQDTGNKGGLRVFFAEAPLGGAELAITGPCSNIGTNGAGILYKSTYTHGPDQYPASEAANSPVPTGLP